MRLYNNDDICIVGAGAIAPESSNVNEFFKNIYDGNCLIKDLTHYKETSSYPYDISIHHSKNKDEKNTCYGHFGSFIDRNLINSLREKNKLSTKDYTNLEVLTIDSIDQSISAIESKIPKKTDLVLGFSSYNEEIIPWISHKWLCYLKDKFPEEKDYFDKFINKNIKFNLAKEESDSYVVNSILLNKVKRHFSLHGKSFFIDSACASSLAAILCASERLKNNTSDLVLLGGIDVCVNPGALTLFSKVKALSNKKCLPFDSRSTGLSCGEAVITFAMMRLEDALKIKTEILGIIKSISFSSDGRTGSIVEPTKEGQLLAYKRAYSNTDISPKDIDYIEAHGTGTLVGDQIEIESLTEFFKEKRIPIGSVKGVMGHTIAAAGAVSLLKGIGILKTKKIPPSPYFKKFRDGIKTHLFINEKTLPIKKDSSLNVAISSFGFGGCNYHLILNEYKEKEFTSIKKNTSSSPIGRRALKSDPVVLCSKFYLNTKDMKEDLSGTQHKMPPKVLSSLDKMQLGAMLAVEKVIKESQLHLPSIDKNKISVISSGFSCLDKYWQVSNQITLVYLKRVIERKYINANVELKNHINSILNKFPDINEDTLPALLNNIIAGRICKIYDFKGFNFHIDNNSASKSIALEMCSIILKKSTGAIFLISCDETYDRSKSKIVRNGISCSLISSLSFALEANLPIAYELSDLYYKKFIATESKKYESPINEYR